MSFPGSFLLVATLMVATGAAVTTEAVAAAKNSDAAHMQVLRQKAGQASYIGPATLVLAAR